MPDVHPGDLSGERLKIYWTRGPGLAKWVHSPHPWTTLRNHLAKYVSYPERLAETYFVAVFGYHSGSRRGKNPVGPG